jgi:Raf kinase inhibitor-like YbhB/YbcL family protein
MAPDVRGLAEGAGNGGSIPPGSTEGRNSGKATGYGGPCPPRGTHRYFFRVFALDAVLDPGPNVTREALLEAMEGHVLARAELMGTYARRPD